ncbi:hypothetical protein GF412_02770 [Candidatus Micrarchaeota archaeon]|nr:hypothetical protein [Candidatus Micrarchaeota archaeon]MBD3417881.1 hypothetical protein [Candidatus Micrarchaeota archaeon]
MKNGNEGVLGVFFAWTIATILLGTMLYPYLQSEGFSELEMLGLATIGFGAFLIPILLIASYGRTHSKSSIFAGMSIMAASLLLLYSDSSLAAILAYFLLSGFGIILFWYPLNVIWFRKKTEENAFRGALYYAIPVSIGVAVPAVAGLITGLWGFAALFATAAAVMVLGLAFSQRIEEKKLRGSLRQAVSAVSGFRTLFFIEGFAWFSISVVALLITLRYFSLPADFGSFISVTAFIAVALSFIFAKMSDKSKKRREFLLVFSGGLGISLVLSSFAGTLEWWFWGMVGISFFKTLFFPFPLAILVDRRGNLAHAMLGRELFLSLGRFAAGIVSVGAYLALGSLNSVLLALGAIVFAYSLVFEFSKKKKLGVK